MIQIDVSFVHTDEISQHNPSKEHSMTRKGFTLIELIVVLAILAILAALIFGGSGGCSSGYYKQKTIGVYQCVKTYTVNNTETQTHKRVDLRPQNGGAVETFVCDDDVWAGVTNSATLYAQFEPGKWYSVSSVGYRQEGLAAIFPQITSVSQAQDPTK